MKQTYPSRRAAALPSLSMLAAACMAIASHANTFNNGETNSIATDTTYGETLYVGINNPDNTLLIESNATVSATMVVVGQLASSTNNAISVVGDSLLIAGTADTNGLATGGVVVGSAGTDAALDLNNGSTLDTDYLYVGFGTNDSGKIDLSGKGTELNVAQDVSVGSAGSTNSISIGDGSILNIGGTLTVGSATSSNNSVTVSGGTLFVNSTNHLVVVGTDATNVVSVGGNGTLQVGGDVDTGTLDDLGIEMAAKANLELGGTLTLDQNEVDSSLDVILNDALSTSTASWSSASLTAIGGTTSDNSLTFTNGATGHAQNIVQIGQSSTSHRNALNVGGSNSTFTADSDLFVGAQGKNNALNVGDGGQADIAGSLYLGSDASATGNQASITSNGTLNVAGDIVVGDRGSNTTLTIDGGQVAVDGDLTLGSGSANNRYNQTGGTNAVVGGFIIGQGESATGKTGFVDRDRVETTGNLAMVGTNAVLDIQQNLTVGLEGGGSILTIRDGGIVNVSGDAVIGEAVGDNYIYLQRDSNTLFNVAGDLVIGKEGGSNRFAAYGGTANIGGDLLLGATTNQHDIKNFIHLETTNAMLNVAGAMHIGASNSLNTLDLAAGATANAGDLFVGTYEGVSNNTVTVTGEGSLLHVANQLEIGSATGTNNTVVVKNGGILNVGQTNIVIAGTNNTLGIADGGTLKTGDWDFSLLTGNATNILLESGSTLHMLGILSGTNMVEGGLNFVLDGTNALWDTGTNALYVGSTTANNSLTLTNGASASTASDLHIGTLDNEQAWPNTLSVMGGSSLEVGGDAIVGYANNLKIDSTSQMHVGGNYEQGKFAILEIGISSNQVQPNLVVDRNAEFSGMLNTNYPIIKIFNEGVGESNIITIVKAGSITIDGETATSGDIRANIATNLLLGFDITLSNDLDNTYIVLDDFLVRTLGEAAGLSGQLLAVADEIESFTNQNATAMIDILSGMNAATANKTMEDYYGEKMSSAPAHNAINLGLQSVSEQLTKRADNTRARMGMAAAGQPDGASGPNMPNQELQGWATGYKTWANKSADNGFDGYDGSIAGFMVGVDLTVADGILFGVAGGRGTSALDKDNGAEIDTDTTFGSVYASLGTKDWFADASVIYGNSSVDAALGTTFDTEAAFDAQNLALYLGGGKEILYGNYLIVTPQASLLGNYYEQDGYEETSTLAPPRKVDSFDNFYLQSALGCSMGFYTALGETTLKPEIRAFWLHELNAKEEDLSYSLVGGTDSYNMQLQAPESDVLKLGGGVAAKLGEYLELRADLDARIASGYSDYTLLGSIRYQF